MRHAHFTIDVDRLTREVFRGCLMIEISLVLLDYSITWNRLIDSPPIRRLFNITREDGLASWFAVTQTTLIALILWMIVALVVKLGANRRERAGWSFVAALFTFLAIDDGALIHERLGSALKGVIADQFATSHLLSSWPTYEWHLIYLPLLAVAGLYMLVFLWRELSAPARWKMLAAFSCLGVAIVMDFAEGIEATYTTLEQMTGIRAVTLKHFSKSIEEFLEMLGMTIFLVIFLRYLFSRPESILLTRAEHQPDRP